MISACCPAAGLVVGQTEDSEAGKVGRGCQKREIGGDLRHASHAGASSAVAASHQVGYFPFDFGPGGPVVGFPVGIGLAGAGSGQA